MSAEAGLVVVGQGPAGTAAAAAYRELEPDRPITVLSAEALPCYSRPRLPEVVAGKAQPKQLCIHPDEWYASRRIQLKLQQRATRIDLANRQVETDTGQNVSFDRLVLAMGAEAMVPRIPGLPGPQAYVLRTIEDAQAIHDRAQQSSQAILIGGGLLGLEAGYSLTQLGLKVKVLEVAPRLLPRQMDDEGSGMLQSLMNAMGFEFYLGVQVQRVHSDNRRVSVILDNGQQHQADLVLVSAGIRPRVDLARDAGLTLGQSGVAVDDQLCTSHPDVWAAGDVAEWRGRVAGLWSTAQQMGTVAGRNASGRHETYTGDVPSTKLKVAGIELRSQGEVHGPNDQVLSRRKPANDSLRKLFFRNHRLIGSIQIGDTQYWQSYQRLIEKGYSVKGLELEMIEPEFDFDRIPGFAE